MAVIITCPDCGRGYDLVDCYGDRDSNGARALQCPHCFALIGRTKHNAADGDLTAPSQPPTPTTPGP